jgi:hypothetical protein
MSTYIYVIKGTLRHIEDDAGKITKLAALTVKDYVAALRAGPGYGTEPHDPRGNITTLFRYAESWKGDNITLDLKSSTGTQYAIAIFGALDGGKIYKALEADPTWRRIGELRAGRDTLKCMVADAKFGTGHDKMLCMVASEHFAFPAGMKNLFMPSLTGRRTPQDLSLYFRSYQ